MPWQCEGGAPNVRTRQGSGPRYMFMLGQDAVVEGWQAKNGTSTWNARTWRLGDGRQALAGWSNEAAGQLARQRHRAGGLHARRSFATSW